ncbi:unnamed protein product [Eretmochelys imbricata]
MPGSVFLQKDSAPHSSRAGLGGAVPWVLGLGLSRGGCRAAGSRAGAQWGCCAEQGGGGSEGGAVHWQSVLASFPYYGALIEAFSIPRYRQCPMNSVPTPEVAASHHLAKGSLYNQFLCPTPEGPHPSARRGVPGYPLTGKPFGYLSWQTLPFGLVLLGSWEFSFCPHRRLVPCRSLGVPDRVLGSGLGRFLISKCPAGCPLPRVWETGAPQGC